MFSYHQGFIGNLVFNNIQGTKQICPTDKSTLQLIFWYIIKYTFVLFIKVKTKQKLEGN